MSRVSDESARRRSFAIISHPDAGKTTLTEKTLLYCGAIREAGEVSAKANRRKTVSDWMELEKQRGISVSSSVLQFDYKKLRVNLLDTPGHQDFGEDTYRTLMAADSAVMVIDVAKGVEPQTRKLFDVCRMRGIPIFTFFNKMDREGRDPFELMEEVESLLKIACVPVTWPIGMGPRFRGVYNRLTSEFVFFEAAEKAGHQIRARTLKVAPSDPALREFIEEEQQEKLIQELELIDSAIGHLEPDDFRKGLVSPTTFASARSGFGIPTFLDIFHDYAPPPQSKPAKPADVSPHEDRFTAFVFKIQANMDKAHRDRIAFMRICSGRFERDMDVKHSRLEKTIRLTHSKQFMAQERETVNEAFAGDIIGVHDPGHFQIGDTLYTGDKVVFDGIPQFSPEIFGRVQLRDPIKRKQLQKGIQQLCEEGMVQMFVVPSVGLQDPILGVVGALQFDVMMYRLKDEYGVDAVLERLPYTCVRWIRNPKAIKLEGLDFRVPLVHDQHRNPVLLFKSQWEMEYVQKNAPQGLEWLSNSQGL